MLIDAFGYQTTFLITAMLQGLAALLLSPMLVLVQAERGARGFGRGCGRRGGSSTDTSTSGTTSAADLTNSSASSINSTTSAMREALLPRAHGAAQAPPAPQAAPEDRVSAWVRPMSGMPKAP